MVKIVESLPVGKQRAEPVVACRLLRDVRLRPERMGKGIHAEGRVQDNHDAQADGHDEPAQRMADPPRDQHGEDDPAADGPP